MAIARLIADRDALESRMRSCDAAMIGPGIDIIADAALPRTVTQLRGPSCDDLRVALDDMFPDFDWLVSADEITIPALFVSDMDSTMIGQECIDELADFAGLKAQISEITERAMQGELDFESALLERVGLLEGLEESAVDRCLAERISPTPGARVLTQTLKAKGARTVLVTGGFHHFADEVAGWLGFDRVVGNRLGVAGAKLTGRLDGPISDASTKLATLREEAAKLGEAARILGSGDGANDIPMLEAADYGFAYRAKPKARAMANGRVDQGDLTVILSLLGIPKEEWVVT